MSFRIIDSGDSIQIEGVLLKLKKSFFGGHKWQERFITANDLQLLQYNVN